MLLIDWLWLFENIACILVATEGNDKSSGTKSSPHWKAKWGFDDAQINQRMPKKGC